MPTEYVGRPVQRLEDPKLVTGYALPKSDHLIAFDNDHTRTPSPRTTLGVKGIGESATIGSAPAVTNAADPRQAVGRDAGRGPARRRPSRVRG